MQVQSRTGASRIGVRQIAPIVATGLVVVALGITAARRGSLAAAVVEPIAGGAGAYGLVEGTPAMKSAGALAFGPGSVLFVGDTAAATVHAIDVQDTTTDASAAKFEVAEIDRKIAAALGTTAEEILIRDMKVHRPSQHIYLSVQRGRGTDATPVILRLSRDGQIQQVRLDGVRYASAPVTNAPSADAKNQWDQQTRPMSITDLVFVDNQVFVAGLSNQQFASDLRRIAFPFTKAMESTSVEIFHTSHNKYETQSPITAFVPIKLKGVPTLLAGYGCAPLATFPIAALKNGTHVRGQTLAELGGGNRPLDMITFTRNGKDVVIVANSSRTLMRLKTEDLERTEPLTKGVDEPYVSAGAPYVSIAEVGVLQLDDLNADYAVVIKRDIVRGTLDLRSLEKKWL